MIRSLFNLGRASIVCCMLMFSAMAVQGQLSTYTFTETPDTYTQVTGTTSTVVGDDATQNGIPIGFNFVLDGVTYTHFCITTNGFIKLGDAATTITGSFAAFSNNLINTAADRPIIAPFWEDNNLGAGTVTYATTGAHPSSVLSVSWHNTKIGGTGANAGADVPARVDLYETTNLIEFIYGTPFTTTNTVTASLGLNAMTSFLSFTPAATSTASTATANNAINATAMAFLAGRKITMSPPVPCTGTPVPGNTVSNSASASGGGTVNLSLQNVLTGSGLLYQWYSSPDNNIYTPIGGANSATHTTAAIAAITWYYCEVTCPGNPVGNSTPIEITVASPPVAGVDQWTFCCTGIGQSGVQLYRSNGYAAMAVCYNSGWAVYCACRIKCGNRKFEF